MAAPTNGSPVWYNDQVQAAALGQLGMNNQPIKAPHMPSLGPRHRGTQFYVTYDYAHPNPGPLYLRSYSGETNYDQYTLSSDRTLQNGAALPAQQGVRLDDHGCYLARRDTQPTATQTQDEMYQVLHDNFGSEFDGNGDIRSRRLPKGLAAKEYHVVGDVDMDGAVIRQGEEGWFYLWWKGIHLLCGDEGWNPAQDIRMYRMRGKYHPKQEDGFSWKKSCRAVIQAAI